MVKAAHCLKLLRVQRGFLPGIEPYSLWIKWELARHFKIGMNRLATVKDLCLSTLQITSSEYENSLRNISVETCDPAGRVFLAIADATQRNIGLPSRAIPRGRALRGVDSYLLILPASEYTWRPALELLRLCTILFLNQEDRQETAQIPARLFKCKKEMQESLPQGVNSLRLLAAAQAMNIPTKRITGRLHRYGWGFTSILMDSSVTQFDSAIGCNASKDKLFTKNILRDAGLPVVEGEVARSVDHAWQIASQFGLPVVLKPRNADGGLEVHVRLSSEEEVREAANAIFARSHQVLVERYYSSRDYRVHVHQGSIFRVVERRPGFVRGDGKTTILELLSLKNLEIAKVVGSQGGQRIPIELDLEAKRMLAYQGLTPASIPTEGDTVYLRGAANISRGGEIVPALDSAHPDNLRLAIRAAEALHLDLAGVDLLLPDISESWLQTGGIICEVNAQPQIATGHDVLLNKLLGGDGRIPIDVVLGLESVLPLKDSLDRRRRQGDSGGIGLVGQDGVFLDDECLSGPPEDQFLATSMLLGCQHLRHLILAPWHDSLAVDGLPIDRFDKLIVCTSADNLCNGQSQSLQPEGKLWSTLKQMCHSCHRTDTLEALLEYFVNGGRE